jgi:hypothetical protein
VLPIFAFWGAPAAKADGSQGPASQAEPVPPPLRFPHAWFWPLLLLVLMNELVALGLDVSRADPVNRQGGVIMWFLTILPVWLLLPIFTYRLWNRIQDGFTRLGPGKAVGFLFIPVLNLAWVIPAWGGFADALNGYRTRHGLPGRASTGVTYTFAVAWWVLLVSSFTPALSLGTLFLWVSCLVFVAHTGRLTSDLKPIPRPKWSAAVPPPVPPPLPDPPPRRCPHCAEPLSADAAFCPRCGRSQAPRAVESIARESRIKCPWCAEWVMAEARICRFCGRTLTSA